jgi:hypothetical protein
MTGALKFATSNSLKFLAASQACLEHNITLDQASIDFVEIQSDNGEVIARHKAAAAFAELKSPVVVSDDTWSIPGLGSFPGPYMKAVNQWFTPADFLRLTVDLADRRIILRQEVVYQDVTRQIAFAVDTPCLLLKEIRGASIYTHLTVTSVDGQHSLAEVIATSGTSLPGALGVWQELCAWLGSKPYAQ